MEKAGPASVTIQRTLIAGGTGRDGVWTTSAWRVLQKPWPSLKTPRANRLMKAMNAIDSARGAQNSARRERITGTVRRR